MTKIYRRNSIRLLFILAVFCLSKPLSVNAQTLKPNAPIPARKAATNPRAVDQPSVDMQILMSGGGTVAAQQRRLEAAQVTIELYRLEQLESQRIAHVSGKAIDYKMLAQASSEIKDRAVKIKFSLPFVVRDKEEKVRREADPAQLDSMLAELSRMIKSFIANPVLRMHSTQDEELRASAGHDLEGIIKLSATINKIAKTLSKTVIEARK